jgi:hypothetical protein
MGRAFLALFPRRHRDDFFAWVPATCPFGWTFSRRLIWTQSSGVFLNWSNLLLRFCSGELNKGRFSASPMLLHGVGWQFRTGGQRTARASTVDNRVRVTFRRLCDDCACDLVITAGCAGFAVRDVTPEGTRAVIERDLQGYGEVMRLRSLDFMKTAIL